MLRTKTKTETTSPFTVDHTTWIERIDDAAARVERLASSDAVAGATLARDTAATIRETLAAVNAETARAAKIERDLAETLRYAKAGIEAAEIAARRRPTAMTAATTARDAIADLIAVALANAQDAEAANKASTLLAKVVDDLDHLRTQAPLDPEVGAALHRAADLVDDRVESDEQVAAAQARLAADLADIARQVRTVSVEAASDPQSNPEVAASVLLDVAMRLTGSARKLDGTAASIRR